MLKKKKKDDIEEQYKNNSQILIRSHRFQKTKGSIWIVFINYQEIQIQTQ